MDEKQQELKPCPFCGAAMDLISRPEYDLRAQGWIECECGASMEESEKDYAIKLWNTRAADPAWKYIARDGNPTKEGEYLIAAYTTRRRVTDDMWNGKQWTCFGKTVYAYRPLPEPPPLLDEEPDSE